jgi:membrane fusion protein, epimerase transport system
MNVAAISTHPNYKPPTSQKQATRLVWGGWWVILLAIVPIGAWMALAPLSMAVVAPAYVKVDLNRRPVQHREGGIVRAVLVRDGQAVKEGEPLLLLGDVGVEADRNRLAYRVQVERAAIARLEATQSLASTLAFAPDLIRAAAQDERIRHALVKETALFEARRHSLVSEVALMKKQRERTEEEIVALRAQIEHAVRAHDSQSKTLEANRKLLIDGFIAPTKFQDLEGALSDYGVKLEERRSELARSQQRLVEIDLKIKAIENEYVKQASDQLKVTGAQLGEIEQERRKSDDAAVRQAITAPASGEVIDLKFTSPGSVIRPGDPIADIVPKDAALMIEGQIRPEDINNVLQGQSARIQFTAMKFRNTAMVTGKVVYVSADRLIDRATNLPYYSVMIKADPESLQAVGDPKLQAGMPAEVYIEGSTQTPVQYLMSPITDTIRKAGRQL